MWIHLDQMKLNYIDEKLRDQIILEKHGLSKPKPYQPSVEYQAFKNLGFNSEILEKEGQDVFKSTKGNAWLKASDFLDITKIVLGQKQQSYLYQQYIPNPKIFNHSDVKDFQNKLNKYFHYVENHEKIVKYRQDKENYFKAKKEVEGEICFKYSIYNRPGILVQLVCERTKKVDSFLIGSKSNIIAYYKPTSEILRVKELVSKEDITEDLIFA